MKPSESSTKLGAAQCFVELHLLRGTELTKLCNSRCGQFEEAKNAANDLASSNCKEQSLGVNCQPVHETKRKFDEAGGGSVLRRTFTYCGERNSQNSVTVVAGSSTKLNF